MLFILIVRSHEEVSFCFPSMTRQLYLVLGVLSFEVVGSHSRRTTLGSFPLEECSVRRRHMPYTSRPVGSVEMFLRNHEKRVLSSLVSGFTFLWSVRSVAVGRGSAVGIKTRYGLDGPGIESRWGEIFCNLPDRPGAHPPYCTMGIGSFRDIMWPGCGVDHLPPSSAEVKERVDVYFYSPSGPSWPVLGRTLPR
jgi:hypothetical protein